MGVKYAALDAFTSYAAGVRVLQQLGQQAKPLPAAVDLTLPAPWELLLAAQWVLTHQFTRMGAEDRTKHDFHHAEFKSTKKGEVLLEVHMARYKTRLRKHFWVEVRLPDSRERCIHGRCTYSQGKTAHVSKMKWAGAGGRSVGFSEVSAVRRVEMIEMKDASTSKEDESIEKLIAEVLRGEKSLAPLRIATGIFGGGSLKVPSHGGLPTRCHAEVHTQLSALQGAGRLNHSQRAAIEAMLLGDVAATVIQGPPGTGKTTVISHAVELWVRRVAPRLPLLGKGRRAEAVGCVARSNVAALNIAHALLKRGLGPNDFRLVVSEEFHFEWHEELYRGQLQEVLLVSDMLKASDMARHLADVRVFVMTTSMLASRKFQEVALHNKALTRLMVDEASQIYVTDLVLPFEQYGKDLRFVAFFGDDCQLPPYGSEWDGAQIPSVFDHLCPAESAASVAAGGGGCKTTNGCGGRRAGGAAGAARGTGGSRDAPSADAMGSRDSSNRSTGPGQEVVRRLRKQPNAFSIGPDLAGLAATPPSAGGQASGGVTDAAAAAGGGAHRLMLQVSYRLPPSLCGLISREIYGGELLSGRHQQAAGTSAGHDALRWVDVVGKESTHGGNSFCNPKEVAVVRRLLQSRFGSRSWTVLTGYDMQRKLLEKEVAGVPRAGGHSHGDGGNGASGSNSGGGSGTLGAGGGGGNCGKGGEHNSGGKGRGHASSTSCDRVYTIDTFQGREDEVIVASLVRCESSLGFMKDDRRVNVMMTRCTQQLVVVGSLQLALRHPETLIGRMAAYCRDQGLVEEAPK